jgi:hypothetical protein
LYDAERNGFDDDERSAVKIETELARQKFYMWTQILLSDSDETDLSVTGEDQEN